MKRKLTFSALLLCLVFLLSACMELWGGYNKIMRNELGDINNYTEYNCIIKNIVNDNGEAFVVAELTAPDSAQPAEYRLRVIEANASVLEENGFFDNVKSGDALQVRADLFTYGDTDFFFVASVKAGDRVYLNEETGMKNIVEMMSSNKSLF